MEIEVLQKRAGVPLLARDFDRPRTDLPRFVCPAEQPERVRQAIELNRLLAGAIELAEDLDHLTVTAFGDLEVPLQRRQVGEVAQLRRAGVVRRRGLRGDQSAFEEILGLGELVALRGVDPEVVQDARQRGQISRGFEVGARPVHFAPALLAAPESREDPPAGGANLPDELAAAGRDRLVERPAVERQRPLRLGLLGGERTVDVVDQGVPVAAGNLPQAGEDERRLAVAIGAQERDGQGGAGLGVGRLAVEARLQLLDVGELRGRERKRLRPRLRDGPDGRR